MALFWNDQRTNLLIEYLRKKEHVYNPNHPNYSVQNSMTECNIFGKKFKPPKSGQEIFDHITAVRNDLIKIKKLIDKGNLTPSLSRFLNKFYFMYISLFGECSVHVHKRKMEKDCGSSEKDKVKIRKKASTIQNEILPEEGVQDTKDNSEECLGDNFESDFAECHNQDQNFDSDSEGEYEKDDKIQSEEYLKQDNENESLLIRGDLLLSIANFIRNKPFLWNLEHPSYSNFQHKRKVLAEFGSTFKPPIPVKLIQYRIQYLRKRFAVALERENDNWHLFKDCQFFLKCKNNDNEENEINEEDDDDDDDDDSNVNLYKIIQFIKNKPYFYNYNHPKYNQHEFKKRCLFEFGQTFNPPLLPVSLRNKISYLKKKFFKYVNQSCPSSWRWFKECNFFFEINDENSNKNKTVIEKTEWPFSTNINRFVKFLEDEPVMYNTRIIGFSNIKKKREICSNYGKTFTPSISAREVANQIKFIRNKILLSFQNEDIKKEKWVYFDKFKFMHEAIKTLKIYNFKDLPFVEDSSKIFDKELHVTKNKMLNIQDECSTFLTTNKKTLTDLNVVERKLKMSEKILFENLENTENFTKDIGTQCNLFVELFQEKIHNIKFKDHNCFEEISKIIESFKTIHTNDEPQAIEKENPLTKFIDIDDSNILDIECSQNNYFEYSDNKKISDMKLNKWSDLDNFSSDSSDYGITEIPFPEKPKKSDYTKNKYYECDICLKKFSGSFFLEKHNIKFHTQRSVLCSICGKINKNYRKMQMHENNCDPNENRFCYDCNKIFKSKITYHDHFNSVHDRKNPYICCCGRSFMIYSKFVFHLNTYHCGTVDSCTIPDYITKEFLESFVELRNSVEGENIEEYKVEKKLKFWCRICNTNSYNNRAYMVHFDKEFHLNAEKIWFKKFNVEGPFECEFCHYNESVFSKVVELVKHRHKFHRKCTLSEYFKKLESSDITTILITEPTDHSKIYSQCHICKATFFMSEFETHFTSWEHLDLEKKWLEKNKIIEFDCNICSIKFKNLLEFLIHKKSNHNEWPTNNLLKNIENEIIEIIPENLIDKMNSKSMYKCSICNFYCSLKATYINHILRHIKEKFIQCSCGVKFITPDKLIFHQKSSGCSKNGAIIPRFVLPSDSSVNVNLIKMPSIQN